jgi:hypothetical protein
LPSLVFQSQRLRRARSDDWARWPLRLGKIRGLRGRRGRRGPAFGGGGGLGGLARRSGRGRRPVPLAEILGLTSSLRHRVCQAVMVNRAAKGSRPNDDYQDWCGHPNMSFRFMGLASMSRRCCGGSSGEARWRSSSLSWRRREPALRRAAPRITGRGFCGAWGMR